MKTFYNNNKIFRKYSNNGNWFSGEVKNLVINNNKEIIRLISSSTDGITRIFDFYSGLFLNGISIFNQELYAYGMMIIYLLDAEIQQ